MHPMPSTSLRFRSTAGCFIKEGKVTLLWDLPLQDWHRDDDGTLLVAEQAAAAAGIEVTKAMVADAAVSH